ncbi:DsbA family oxidoreductase [Imbroritus primus]|uniref:DsbA family oxidoreductase n=1 Tax=Imbroritus primus TaxID=3058603 RepID=UPI003D16145D
MTTPIKIDFVSDVSCPWCAIGLHALERALAALQGTVTAEITLQPFELNPDMPPAGQEVAAYLHERYGMSAAQLAQNSEAIRARGAEEGFTFRMERRTHIYNTFDAHRLLHWAAPSGRQLALKHALLKAYFEDGRNPGAHDVLLDCVEAAGLDRTEAQAVLASDAHAEAVRAQEQFYQAHGIRSVPAIIINDRHLIEGGQPAHVFEAALRRLAETASQ